MSTAAATTPTIGTTLIAQMLSRASDYGPWQRSLALAPVEGRSDPGLKKTDYFSDLCVATETRLAEYEFVVKCHLEPTVVSALEANRAKDRGPSREDLGRQAHGPVQIVSRHAELD
jgi:hypothetical protein